MSILDILFRNSGQKSRTLRPADQSTPLGYRGALEHNVDRCTGCGTCAYVCSPGAIRVEKRADGVLWHYQAVRCTFCARCAEFCPTKAIRLTDQANPPTIAESTTSAAAVTVGALDPLVTEHRIDFRPCERCGQPFVPLPAPVLAQMTGREVDDGLAGLMRLCEKCRARVFSQRLKDSFAGISKREGK